MAGPYDMLVMQLQRLPAPIRERWLTESFEPQHGAEKANALRAALEAAS
ncbi:MAG TPA: hypothetical protein VF637_14755 [Sphingomicrobium sp.]|jgi:hypothetical protein